MTRKKKDMSNEKPAAAVAFLDALGQLQAEAAIAEKKLADWAQLDERIQENLANSSNVVALDVGGTVFKTSKDTLLRVEGSYFHALLGSGHWKPDSPGEAYFLDLDPNVFHRVLVFLRTGKVSMEGMTTVDRGEFKSMMEYLKLNEALKVAEMRWDPTLRAPEMALTNDARSIERSATNANQWKAAIVGAALEGCVRIRVDDPKQTFYVGVGPKVGFDGHTSNSLNACYYFTSNTGQIARKGSAVATLAAIRAGDVVTIRRGPSQLEFALNDGRSCQVDLVDVAEELFPVVFMAYAGTKVTIVDEL
ncbi:hypothetical protein H310_01907 [Aphanomyces invadans]|uniref:BTB domain-containing protein n=1 Tax=Aphanomyces invadans TaxID=157072 RepID=A0A024UNF5_9STRA|nr:hypothetical protein H310_01907 [Aphanomyces invadans]ETW07372.1 hypothetical protein H310_01907 [Aphanomyces invadans]|eukprot:XP_008863465.1 hypothetical protein H310_01907 [Aphanomyces invadans]